MKKLMMRKEKLISKLSTQANFLRGSVTSVCSTCNRAKCICDKKNKKKAYRLTYKDASQKTQTVYVSRDQLQNVRRMMANYTGFRKTVQEIQDVNIRIFKSSQKL